MQGFCPFFFPSSLHPKSTKQGERKTKTKNKKKTKNKPKQTKTNINNKIAL
jgi:hypothetical protein